MHRAIVICAAQITAHASALCPVWDPLPGRFEENELWLTIVGGQSMNLLRSDDRPKTESLVHSDGCRVVFVRKVVSDGSCESRFIPISPG